MVSDPVFPSDEAEGTHGKSYFESQKSQLEKLSDEDWKTFSHNLMTGNRSDPAVKAYWENVLHQMSLEMNRELKRQKEASRKLKESIEGNDN